MVRREISAVEKIEAVEKYKRGKGSQDSIARECGVKQSSFRQWIAKYEAMGPSGLAAQQGNNRYSVEFKTAGRGRGSYMTKGRSVVLEERIEIVSYCIANGKDYCATIEKYGVSYQQIYSWVRKYEAKGVEGLIDKRGKRKPLEEMTEIERLQAENKMLKAENKHKEMEIAVLKKVREIERRRG